jgi:RHS repeat-associated protein
MATVNYIWDPLADSYLMETDASGSTQAVYTVEPDLYGRVISQRRGVTSSYFHFDATGSTRDLTNSSDTVTDTNMYDAWGVNRESSGTTVNPFEYVGEMQYYFVSAIAAYHARRRSYRAYLGRWASEDPWRFVETANLYVYVENAPINGMDPSGTVSINAPMSPTGRLDPSEGQQRPFREFQFAFPDLPPPSVFDPSPPLDNVGQIGVPCKGRKDWKPNDCGECPPCPCSLTAWGKPGLPKGLPIDQIVQDVIRDTKVALKCKVVSTIGRPHCGQKGLAWTCATGQVKHKRTIFLCFSADLRRCALEALIRHELVHAIQFCNQPSGQSGGIPQGQAPAFERPGWQKQCAYQNEQDCCAFLRPKKNCDTLFRLCVNKGVNFSKGLRLPCKDLIGRFF